MTNPVTRGVRTWRFPTAHECETAHRLTHEQRARYAYALEQAARRMAAILCDECDMEKQQIHAPVSRFLEMLREASASTRPTPPTAEAPHEHHAHDTPVE